MIRIGRVVTKEHFPGKEISKLLLENGKYVWACFRPSRALAKTADDRKSIEFSWEYVRER